MDYHRFFVSSFNLNAVYGVKYNDGDKYLFLFSSRIYIPLYSIKTENSKQHLLNCFNTSTWCEYDF